MDSSTWYDHWYKKYNPKFVTSTTENWKEEAKKEVNFLR